MAGERGASTRRRMARAPLRMGDVDWQRLDRLLFVLGKDDAVRHYGQGGGCLQVADEAGE